MSVAPDTEFVPDPGHRVCPWPRTSSLSAAPDTEFVTNINGFILPMLSRCNRCFTLIACPCGSQPRVAARVQPSVRQLNVCVVRSPLCRQLPTSDQWGPTKHRRSIQWGIFPHSESGDTTTHCRWRQLYVLPRIAKSRPGLLTNPSVGLPMYVCIYGPSVSTRDIPPSDCDYPGRDNAHVAGGPLCRSVPVIPPRCGISLVLPTSVQYLVRALPHRSAVDRRVGSNET